MSRIYLAYRSKKQRFCAVQAFCAAKPWRRANSLRPSILISCRNPKKEVTTYVVTSFFGAGDEARTRYLDLGKVALYQMSYARKRKIDYTRESRICQPLRSTFFNFFSKEFR